jgi:hypothetical protein
MLTHVHFVVVAGWLLIGIAGLLWILGCAVTAHKMDREGLTFWKSFVACFLFSPLVGILAIAVARLMRPNRPLVQTATRG